MEKISTINDLHKLQVTMRKYYLNNKPKEYLFQLPQLSDEENNRYSAYINIYSKECGCNTGGFVMSMGFVITVTYYFISGGNFASIRLHQCISLVGIIICAALAGKIFGIVRARWKMIRLVSLLITKTTNSTIIS